MELLKEAGKKVEKATIAVALDNCTIRVDKVIPVLENWSSS